MNYESSDDAPWSPYRSNIKKIVIEEGITTIGKASFPRFSILTNVIIPNSVVQIYSGTFSQCSNLTEIEIPDNVNSIGEFAFYLCSRLKSIKIPNSVVTIGANAFVSCQSLIDIKLPSHMTIISNGLFSGCASIKTFEIPDSVVTIGNGAFYTCYTMKSIKMSDHVVSIGSDAFYYCRRITSIKIPKSVMSIGEGAFGALIDLDTIDLYWDAPLSINKSVFGGTNISLVTIIVPTGTKTLYEAAPVWQDFGTIIERAPEVPVTSVSISPKSATLMAGGTLQLVATVSPSNATNQNVTWSSSNDAVATVDATGKVTAIGAGSAIITATTVDGGKTATFSTTVFEIAVTSVTLNTSADSVFIGGSLQLTATINPLFASNKNVTWSSSNDAVATVDATGNVTGVSEGTAVITVTTNNGKTATCTVTVYQLMNYVTIEIPIGDTGESIVFDIERVAGSDEVNSFVMGFPEGFDIDPGSVILIESLSEGLVLTVTPLGYNVWMFEVSAPSTFSLRSAMKFSRITNITYRITGSMADTHEIIQCNTSLSSVYSTDVPAYELVPKVGAKAGETANNPIDADRRIISMANGLLTVDTPDNEMVRVYSVVGTLVYTAEKMDGKAIYQVSNLPNGIYVVTGSKGWNAKVLKK
ncbi:MAG: leucine-rich repeat protein [Tannerella sp.]|nr:leucine-rich repeat protein [Tannerella sp.]